MRSVANRKQTTTGGIVEVAGEMQPTRDDRREKRGNGLTKLLRADISVMCEAIGHKRRYIAFPDAQDPEVIHDYGWQCETCGKPLNNG